MAKITRCERTENFQLTNEDPKQSARLQPEPIWEDLPADAASRRRQKKKKVQQSEASVLAVLVLHAVGSSISNRKNIGACCGTCLDSGS